MGLVQAIILGIVQGLTEFLPVSSSGHLVIFQHMFGLKEPELVFDIAVHVGTLIAVVIYFKKDLVAIIGSMTKMTVRLTKGQASLMDSWSDPNVKLALLIVLGSIPTAIMGLGFHQVANHIFSSVRMAGLMLLITGSVIWATRRMYKTDGDIESFSAGKALIIGFVQGMAILPGISRSGSTIAAGLFLGLNRELAARYAFLLSLPAIAGAALMAAGDMVRSGDHVTPAIYAGMISAGVVGYLSLSLLVFIVKKGRLHFFSPYCWLMGGLALAIGT